MRATVLSDNTGANGLKGEWGLSVYIEYEGRNILLDAGASSLFLKNAAALGKDISAVELAVLSHAHYDHGNGLPAFFDTNATAPCYAVRSEETRAFARRAIFYKYIGVPKSLEKAYAGRMRYITEKTELLPGVWVLPHEKPVPEEVGRSNKLYQRKGLKMVPDTFTHEQSLIFKTENGLAVFNSCSHAGGDVVLREVTDAFPGEKISALIGGMHLFMRTEAEVHAFADRLKAQGIRKLYTGHCTGDKALQILSEELGDRLVKFQVGLVMDL